MSKESGSRRLAMLGVIALIVCGVAAWRYFGTGTPEPNSAAANKAEELSARYEAAGGTTESDGDADEVSESLEDKGPQSIDD